MKLFFLQSLIGVVALFLAAWAGHYLTRAFLAWTAVIPDGHTRRQRDISKWIGVTERVVVALLAMCGSVAVTVFVFATKAALVNARNTVGDEQTKREITEYILIGTLTSYFFGLLFGLAGWKTALVVEQYCKSSVPQTQTNGSAILMPVPPAIGIKPAVVPEKVDAKDTQATQPSVLPAARKP